MKIKELEREFKFGVIFEGHVGIREEMDVGDARRGETRT